MPPGAARNALDCAFWDLAAKRSGVREVILPHENEVNVREDLKSEQIGDMQVHYVKSMDEVVDLALEKPV